MAELRVRITRMYSDRVHHGHFLLIVTANPNLSGFDRLAVPLGYVRVLTEITDHAPVVMTAPGLAVTVVGKNSRLPLTLHLLSQRLFGLSPPRHPPGIWIEALPTGLPSALHLLDDLCE